MTLPRLVVLLAAALCAQVTSAATITRKYTFTGSGTGFMAPNLNLIVQLDGAFTYIIPEVGNPYFQSFTATSDSSTANGPIFLYSDGTDDITQEANNPTINGTGPACIGGATGAAATLHLMTTCLGSQN